MVKIRIPSDWDKNPMQTNKAAQFHIFYRSSISGFRPMIEAAGFLYVSLSRLYKPFFGSMLMV